MATLGKSGASVTDETKALYEELLESYRTSASPDPIPNRLPWQAKCAVQALAECALEKQTAANEEGGDPVTVLILTSSLPDYVYGGKASQILRDFRDAGGEIRVLVWNDTMRQLEDSFWRSLRMGRASLRLSGTKEFGDTLNHFCLVGSEAYRLEAPHQYYRAADFSECSPEIPARICFSDPAGGARIAAFFERLWEYGVS